VFNLKEQSNDPLAYFEPKHKEPSSYFNQVDNIDVS